MSRISQTVAADVARKLVAETFDPLVEKHSAPTVAYVEEALETYLGADNLRTFRALPATFHFRQSHFRVLLKEVGHYVTIKTSETLVVPHVFGDWNASSLPVEAGALADKLSAHAIETERLKSERKRLADTTEKTLRALGSIARIRAEWPEAAKYLPAVDKPKLPAVLPSTITEQLAAADTPAPKTKTARGRNRAA